MPNNVSFSDLGIRVRTFVGSLFRFMIRVPEDLGAFSKELALLQLRKKSPLGEKGKQIVMHRDNTIFEGVSRNGYWAIETADFLASGDSARSSVLVDIGAHAGLVSLQTLNLEKSINRAVLIEPVPSNQQAIAFNLSGHNIEILPYALGDRNGNVDFFVRNSNRGNSSIFEGNMRRDDYERTTVKIRDSNRLCKDAKISSSEKIILKCDCEGYDAHILARVGDSFWSQVERGTIEVWSHENISEQDVRIVVDKLRAYEFLAWDPKGVKTCDLRSLAEFWLSGKDEIREIYFSLRS